MRTAILFLSVLFAACRGARAQAALALEADTDRGFYLADSRMPLYVAAWVRATPPATPAVRNVAFVLDRSGSMAGAPLATVRQATLAALKSMSGQDIASIVVFGSEVETLLEATRCDKIAAPETRFARVEPSGGAALFDALNQGAAQLRRFAGPNTVNHLILLTDGAPTKGPREPADFVRLAESLARDGISLSTLGLSEDFDEDLLAALARAGSGEFHYVDRLEKIPDLFLAEVGPLSALAARDATLTVEYAYGAEEVGPNGWRPGTAADRTVTWHFPRVLAGRELRVLAGAQFTSRSAAREVATVRLQWTDAADGTVHQTQRSLTAVFETASDVLRGSAHLPAFRLVASTLISGGLQHAIEQFDKNDPRRALRALRRARDDAAGLNDDPEDAGIAAQVRVLDDYLKDVQPRGLNALDRKTLRSGLLAQFDPPMPEDDGKK